MKRRIMRGASAMIAVAVSFLLTFPAAAQSGEISIGRRLWEILNENWAPIFFVIVLASFVLGIFLLVRGLTKLMDATPDGGRGGAGRNSGAEGILYILAATLLIALPQVAGIGVTTITGTDGGIFGGLGDRASISRDLDLETGGHASLGQTGAQFNGFTDPPQEPDNCYQASEPAVCMARNLAKNAAPVGVLFIFALAFIAGLWGFASTLSDLTKSHSNGGRMTQGWGTKLVISVLLMNSPWLFYSISYTVLGSTTITEMEFNTSSSLLSYTFQDGLDGKAEEFIRKYKDLIGYVLVILAFFGVWAFVRGLTIVKATAEGKTQGAYMNGAVFMVAGILLANAKVSTCAILYTVGGSGMTYGFCS